MSDLRIANRYARSLFDLSVQKKQVEDIHNDMNLFLHTCISSRELLLLLRNPIVPPFKKLAILEKIFAKKVGLVAMEFMRLVVKKNREAYLVLIAEQFHKFYNEYKGIETATLTTPTKLDKKLKKEFLEFIESINNKEIELTEEVDPELIGGFIVKTGDQRIDTSIKTKLSRMHRGLTDKSFQKTI